MRERERKSDTIYKRMKEEKKIPWPEIWFPSKLAI